MLRALQSFAQCLREQGDLPILLADFLGECGEVCIALGDVVVQLAQRLIALGNPAVAVFDQWEKLGFFGHQRLMALRGCNFAQVLFNPRPLLRQLS